MMSIKDMQSLDSHNYVEKRIEYKGRIETALELSDGRIAFLVDDHYEVLQPGTFSLAEDPKISERTAGMAFSNFNLSKKGRQCKITINGNSLGEPLSAILQEDGSAVLIDGVGVYQYRLHPSSFKVVSSSEEQEADIKSKSRIIWYGDGSALVRVPSGEKLFLEVGNHTTTLYPGSYRLDPVFADKNVKAPAKYEKHEVWYYDKDSAYVCLCTRTGESHFHSFITDGRVQRTVQSKYIISDKLAALLLEEGVVEERSELL